MYIHSLIQQIFFEYSPKQNYVLPVISMWSRTSPNLLCSAGLSHGSLSLCISLYIQVSEFPNIFSLAPAFLIWIPLSSDW